MEIGFYDPDGPNGWLANFYYSPFFLDGREWPTVEHYFQAQKFKLTPYYEDVAMAETPSQAKALAKTYKSYRDPLWSEKKQAIMRAAVKAKFSAHKNLAEKLCTTGVATIVEKSDDDLYWGIGADGSGQNIMGKLLMSLRSEICRR